MGNTLVAETAVRKQLDQGGFLHGEKWVMWGRQVFPKESGFA